MMPDAGSMQRTEVEAAEGRSSNGPLIDTHAHAYTLDMPLSPTAWHRPPRDAPIEAYIHELDAHGITHAVLAGASIYGDYNDYQIAALRKYPRLRGTVILNNPATDRYILEMMKADGVVGVRFQRRNVANPPDLSAPEYRLLLRRVIDLDWHVHILENDGERIIKPIADLEAAGVKLVIDHFGRPAPARGVDCEGFKAVLRSVEKGNTWVKLSAGYRQGSRETAKALAAELLKTAGPERLFWGSDWPFAGFEDQVSYADTVRDFFDWIPDAAARRKIGGETAFKFYFG
jgi:predicted TIM-barrel fold metal-dependent hydrolase